MHRSSQIARHAELILQSLGMANSSNASVTPRVRHIEAQVERWMGEAAFSTVDHCVQVMLDARELSLARPSGLARGSDKSA